ncbi:hypothetical protein BH10PSE5_BH10PSE5_01600 [soil metagenome]
MTEDQFIALDRPAARQALKLMSAHDAMGKRTAYMRAHGVAADPLLLKSAEGAAGQSSVMRTIGVSLVVVGAVVAAISMALIATAIEAASIMTIAWLALGSSASGLGVIMWIAGTIEDRLIEIRDRLKLAA